jgi:hypothetical protein
LMEKSIPANRPTGRQSNSIPQNSYFSKTIRNIQCFRETIASNDFIP